MSIFIKYKILLLSSILKDFASVIVLVFLKAMLILSLRSDMSKYLIVLQDEAWQARFMVIVENGYDVHRFTIFTTISIGLSTH
jgi:hypothetical protein